MERSTYEGLRNKAKQRHLLQKMSKGLQLQMSAWERQGIPPLVHPAPEMALRELDLMVNQLNRDICVLVNGTSIGEFMQETRGLSVSVPFLCGLLPPMADLGITIADKETGELRPHFFPNVAKVWKYLGLHVEDGAAPRRKRGEFSGWSAELKSIAIVYIGEPMIKARGPYRIVYDERRAGIEERHPQMPVVGCEFCAEAAKKNKALGKKKYECADVGGIHWTKAHIYADARRVMTKAIIADIWAVSNGKQPRYGQVAHNILPTVAEVAA